MTIAAGFLCPDGLVFAADTLYSGMNKRHAAKVWWFEKKDVVVALAGAGDAVLIRRARDDIKRGMRDGMSTQNVVDLAESALYALIAKHISKDNDSFLEVLLGIRTPSELSLYENQASGSTLAEVDTKSKCIGCGWSMGIYFADWLFRPKMPTHWVRTIAAHLLKQTKKYADGCGGKSHILIVPTSGPPQFLSDGVISELEGQLDEIEDAIRKALIFSPGIVGTDISEATREVRQGVLKQLKDVSRSQFIRMPVGQLLAITHAPTLSAPQREQESAVQPAPQSPTDDPKVQPPSPE
jgi:20S proteasome alpha/beta subunit